MVDREYIELMHYEIDGVIAADDRHRLQTYLEGNPEAQALHEELKRVSNTLQAVQSVEPPATLKRNIFNNLPKNLYGQKRAPERTIAWFDFLKRKPKLGFSLSFAVGLACGLVLFTLPSDMTDVNNSDLMGTMQAFDSPQSRQQLSSLEILEDGFSISIELQRAEKSVFVAMHLRSAQELEFAFEFDQNDLQFSGFQTKEAIKNDLHIDMTRVSLITGHFVLQLMASGPLGARGTNAVPPVALEPSSEPELV
ncbi:hypothetical protein MJD09_04110, partial [bacterium]|nr:hypothetical protein [bacterium]